MNGDKDDIRAIIDRHVPAPAQEARQRARLTTAHHATDPEDLRDLLNVLGLLR